MAWHRQVPGHLQVPWWPFLWPIYIHIYIYTYIWPMLQWLRNHPDPTPNSCWYPGTHQMLGHLLVEQRPNAHPTNSISIKFNENMQCYGLKCAQPITLKFSTCHDDSVTVVTCAKFWTYYEQEHYKFSFNFKFDRNFVSGTGTVSVTHIYIQ